MKHTPGPWKIWVDDFGIICVESKDTIIANNLLDTNDKDLSPEEIEEYTNNARLIAAAPDLLEACKYVVSWHREHDSGEGELYGLDFVTTCISAIAKATKE